MKGKRGLAVILSLITLLVMMFVAAVPGWSAQKKSNSKKSNSAQKTATNLILTKNDFYFSDSQGRSTTFDGQSNYIDWFANSPSVYGDDFNYMETFTHCRDNMNRNCCMFTGNGPVYDYEDVYLTFRPGINFGSTEAQVMKVYGPVKIHKYSEKDSLDIGQYDPSNVPVEFCLYGYYKTGRLYVQVFSFNDQKELCKILWDEQASDGKFS